MEKRTGKNETSNTEGSINPDAVFTGDALVVDYLTHLLTSTPATPLDSGEIHMLHLAIEAGWKLVGGAPSTDTALHFETGQSKVDVAALENENKHLKFKAELAHIDSQVLRSENSNLKVEIAGLKTQILGMQGALDTLLTENNELKLKIETHRNLPDVPEAPQTEEAAPHDPAYSSDQTIEVTDVREAEQVAPDVTNIDSVEQEKEPELIEVVQQDVTTREPVQETPLPTAGQNRTNDCTGSGVAADTAIISRAHPVNDTTSRHEIRRDVILTPHNRTTVVTPSPQYVKPASKIIKQHDIKSFQSKQETAPIVTITTSPPVQYAAPAIETVREPDAVPHPEPEPETIPAAEQATHTEMLPQDSTAELDVPTAPAPKVVVRRNVMNYEDLQKEADSSHTPVTGHTVIL